MNTAFMLVRTEFRLFFRNFAGVFFVLLFPIFLLLFFGSMFGNDPIQLYNGHGTIDVDVPVFSCVVLAITGILLIPWTVTRYRENKILKRYMATPIKPRDILASQLAVNLVMAAVGIITLVLAAKIVFDIILPTNIISVVTALIITAVSIFSIGLFITSISSGIRASNVISLLVYFPMLFLSGAIMPLDTMPDGMAGIGRMLPFSYGIDLVKGVWFGGNLFDFSTDILILIIVFFVCTTGSLILFRWE